MKTNPFLNTLCSCVLGLTASAQTMIDAFEYPNDWDLQAYWSGSANTVVGVSDSVSLRASGTNSMKVTFNFPSGAWATEIVSGTFLPTPISISSNQYISFRLRGDPAFAASPFKDLYLYFWDINGNCGRWGKAVSVLDEWQVVNHLASSYASSWNCPPETPPDLSQISQFKFYQYGSGAAAIDPYTATIYIDELQVRDTPLVEFPPASPPRELLDDFESYVDDAALNAFYRPENSPAATVTTASLISPAPQGNKALKLAIDFAPGQWPWGSVRSAVLTNAPFSIPANAIVTFKLKGDPSFTPIADGGTTFWISFYDKGGSRANYSTGPVPMTNADWTTIEVPISSFWGDLTTIDFGNIIQWRLLAEGWTGTAENQAMSGAFYVDDVRITMPKPLLTMAWEGTTLKVNMDRLSPGKSYELRTSSDLSQWTTATTIDATAPTASWTVQLGQQPAFFRLAQKP